MKFVHRIAGVLDAAVERTGAAAAAERTVPTGLYECDECETTYISTEMETCPACRTGVESVATERDLGLV